MQQSSSFQQSSTQQSAISSSNQQMSMIENCHPEEQALPPKFITSSADLTCMEGDQVRLTCRVSGRPAPEIIWYKGGGQVIQDERHKVVVNEQGCHALLVTSATLTDQGEIGCIARNRSGESSFTCKLTVLPKATKTPPSFAEKLQSCRIKEG